MAKRKSGRSIYKYVAIFECIEVNRALPVTKGINFKSGKLIEQNEQSIRKSIYLMEKNINIKCMKKTISTLL